MFATKKCQIVGQVKCLRSYVILCNFKNWICEWKLHDIGWNTEQFRSSFQTSRCTGPCDNLYLLLLSGLGSLSIYWFVLLPQGQSCFTRFKIWKISLDTIHFQYSRLISWKADWINKRWTSQGKLGKQRLLQSYLLLLCHERAILLCVIFMRCPRWEVRLCSGVTTAWNAVRTQGTADKATGSELNGIKFKILCVSCLIVLSSFAGKTSKQKKHKH